MNRTRVRQNTYMTRMSYNEKSNNQELQQSLEYKESLMPLTGPCGFVFLVLLQREFAARRPFSRPGQT